MDAANQYLQTQAFSKQGLIDQLDSSAGSGFPVGDARAAVDSLNVDWNAEAVKSAREYLQTSSFSCQGLVEQLSSTAGSQFTVAEARHAAHTVGLCGSGGSRSSGVTSSGLSVSGQNAVNAAKQYLQTEAFSKQGLIDQLDSSAGSGFSVGDATAAVDSLSVNWDAEAVQSARDYLQTSSFSCQGLIEQLSSAAGSQFTAGEAQYAAQAVGLC